MIETSAETGPAPIGPAPVADLATGLGDAWREETVVLARHGVREGRQLANGDLAELPRPPAWTSSDSAPSACMPKCRTRATSTPRQQRLSPRSDHSREALAGSSPVPLVQAIVKAFGPNVTRDESSRHRRSTGGSDSLKGIDPAPYASRLPIRRILESADAVTSAVQRIAPDVSVIAVSGLLNPFNRFLAVAEARALMDAAGVGDLSALGTFRVQGRHVIHPGTYVAWPRPWFTRPDFATDLVVAIRSTGSGFRHLRSVDLLDDALHLIPNPVTDAVIIGSLMEFVEDGRLVIGRDVTSLTIITEEILYSDVNEITYEDQERSPEPRAPMSPAQATTGTPRNDRNVYSPGSGNTGRDGGTGSVGETGDAGSDGDSLGAAPDVTIYVQRTPQGLPDLRLAGRRGGAAQPGQHGGAGSDGARGREACSGACYCHRGPGHGGTGGNGGRGGDGGSGGSGGTGSALRICTLPDNIAPLATGRPYFIDLAGGPGGNAGSPGRGGEPGRGGSPGDDSWPWCEEEPSRVGHDGGRGPDGSVGPNGRRGNDGQFTLQPITLSDWNAVFNQPWIVRLEPWSGIAGSLVHVVARNLTTDTMVNIDGSPPPHRRSTSSVARSTSQFRRARRAGRAR